MILKLFGQLLILVMLSTYTGVALMFFLWNLWQTWLHNHLLVISSKSQFAYVSSKNRKVTNFMENVVDFDSFDIQGVPTNIHEWFCCDTLRLEKRQNKNWELFCICCCEGGFNFDKSQIRIHWSKKWKFWVATLIKDPKYCPTSFYNNKIAHGHFFRTPCVPVFG